MMRIAIAFLAAPLAWTLHLLLSYLLVTVGCANGWSGLRLFLLLLTVLCAGGALWPAVRLLRSRPRMQLIDWLAQEEQATPTPRFLRALGMLITAVFVLAIVLGGIGPWLVTVCGSSAH